MRQSTRRKGRGMEPRDEVQEMIDLARLRKHWLFVSYQQMWFSPTEMEKARANGQFRWRACNFKIRDPQELLADLIEAVVKAERAVAEYYKRLE